MRVSTISLKTAAGAVALALSAATAIAAPPAGQHGKNAHHGKSSSHHGKTTRVLYTCVMHPEVTSTNPHAKCPKCGMALVRKK